MNLKLMILLVIIFIFFSNTVYACFIPNRCDIGSVYCVDWIYTQTKNNINLTLYLKPETNIENLRLEINDCELVRQSYGHSLTYVTNQNFQNLTLMEFSCVPQRADFLYGWKFMPDFFSPCPRVIWYQKAINAFDGQKFLMEGMFRQHSMVEIPRQFTDLTIKRLFNEYTPGIVSLMLIMIFLIFLFYKYKNKTKIRH